VNVVRAVRGVTPRPAPADATIAGVMTALGASVRVTTVPGALGLARAIGLGRVGAIAVSRVRRMRCETVDRRRIVRRTVRFAVIVGCARRSTGGTTERVLVVPMAVPQPRAGVLGSLVTGVPPPCVGTALRLRTVVLRLRTVVLRLRTVVLRLRTVTTGMLHEIGARAVVPGQQGGRPARAVGASSDRTRP
jgi:hypothetical protein